MLLFTKPGCKKCDDVKKRIPVDAAVRTYDITTAEGLAELAYHELISEAEKMLPILIMDGKPIAGDIPIRKALREYC